MGYDENTFKMIEQNKLSLDDTFEFGCDSCGKCCRNREVLILAGYDVFRIANYLGLSCKQVLEMYCFGYIGSDSKLPIVSAKQRPDKTCPFLRNSLCEIHSPKAKPLTCMLFPLGRYLQADTGAYTYFTQDVDCGTKEVNTLHEWLDKWSIQELDEDCKLWGQVLIELSRYCLKIKDVNSLKRTQNMILVALYVDYDINGVYRDNLIKNIKNLEKLLPGFKSKLI